MRLTKSMNLDGTPVAMKSPDGEWVEVGHLTDSVLTVDTEDYTVMETPFRVRRDIYLSLDVTSTEKALELFREIYASQAGES